MIKGYAMGVYCTNVCTGCYYGLCIEAFADELVLLVIHIQIYMYLYGKTTWDGQLGSLENPYIN